MTIKPRIQSADHRRLGTGAADRRATACSPGNRRRPMREGLAAAEQPASREPLARARLGPPLSTMPSSIASFTAPTASRSKGRTSGNAMPLALPPKIKPELDEHLAEVRPYNYQWQRPAMTARRSRDPPQVSASGCPRSPDSPFMIERVSRSTSPESARTQQAAI